MDVQNEAIGMRCYPDEIAQIVVAETDHSSRPVASINSQTIGQNSSSPTTIVKRKRNQALRRIVAKTAARYRIGAFADAPPAKISLSLTGSRSDRSR